MRLDKFLKNSRLIKRRTVANEMASRGRVMINGKVGKAGSEVKPGDILEIGFGQGTTKVRILEVKDNPRKEEAQDLYEILG